MTATDLGPQIITSALDEQDVKSFIDYGWGLDWINDPANVYKAVVFPGIHGDAWKFILKHYESHGQPPTRDRFFMSYPGYELVDEVSTAGELIEVGAARLRAAAASVALGDLQQILGTKNYDSFADRCLEASVFMQNLGRESNTVQVWDAAGQNVDALLNRVVERGIETGIDAIDSQDWFTGFQPGNLITYLGRAKAGKTSLALKSVLQAGLRQRKRVLVVTVEISAQDIQDRLDAFSAGVGLTRLMLGNLNKDEKDRVRKVYRDKGDFDPRIYIVQPVERYTVSDLHSDIDKYNPDYVVVDGFYFMTDRISGKPGAHWEGHDNLAREIKRLAMQTRRSILVTHQVREKQLGAKKGAGIDDGAMMGGTGLIMASDMVVGLDMGEDKVSKITCTRSRSQSFKDVRGEWDWETCAFNSRLAEEEWTGDDDESR